MVAGGLPLACFDSATTYPMAIIFELVVNFGLDDDAVADATEELDRMPTVEVRGVQLPVTPRWCRTVV